MRSFLLACISIVVIGVGAHYATDYIDTPAAGLTTSASVRLD